ncbi:tRNA uridine-5-carboxymethylaminomethyl(34) synthesis GTPase MnmE [Granulicella sibirica]|uniref:tRNA modification GTPase MnmE n=1 Tax=Granulicella sibirica TaxID=2479048 RepID=A0A4Q0T505_9BACT|nr:tRNA uridine-5-carboxymethylaminomethyl(34) synthesis GTPase MnmE [Granulicella sibirica]RXH58447.1 GTPase and tRNA-U34 5-formylation enzyme TrmE [Granulicella sibirica]
MDPDLTLEQDTIVAVATPPGRGGIGIVRLSGPAALQTLMPLLKLEVSAEPRRATFVRILDPASGHLIDEAVITYFAAPNSYTAEDVLEIASHGSPVVLGFLIEQALAGGARLARAGEFTQRAFLNGRMDLTQAEAVRDLIDATTHHQARLAAEQLGGALSRRLSPTKRALLYLIASLEAGIDFAEDDIDVLPDEKIVASLDAVEAPLRSLADSFQYGRILHAGLKLAIVGEPNAGKSSLFNRLLDRDRAIVTATPGTTRDLISERVAIEGIPVELIDTAGLRTTTDEAEMLGIAKSHEALAAADLILVVTDASKVISSQERLLRKELENRPYILVRNKTDLLPDTAGASVPGLDEGVHVSALTGVGIDILREAITSRIHGTATLESGLLTNVRQHDAVSRSLAALSEARRAVAARIPHEMVMLNLYAALQPLDELTGTTTPDDVLNLVFSTFCIGK